MPGFPGAAFPFVPPGAPAAAGNAQGFGGQQFGFSGFVVGGNALPGGNGFVMRTWQIGPDGALIEVPPPAAEPRQKPRVAKPKARVDRGLGKAKKPPPRDDAAKARRVPRARPAPPAEAAASE